jgi:hypothetical protein
VGRFKSISIRDHFELTSSSLQIHFDRFHFACLLVSHRFHFGFTSMSLRFHLASSSMSNRASSRFEVEFHLATRPHARTKRNDFPVGVPPPTTYISSACIQAHSLTWDAVFSSKPHICFCCDDLCAIACYTLLHHSHLLRFVIHQPIMVSAFTRLKREPKHGHRLLSSHYLAFPKRLIQSSLAPAASRGILCHQN